MPLRAMHAPVVSPVIEDVFYNVCDWHVKKKLLENHKTQSTYYIYCAYLHVSMSLCTVCGCICFLYVCLHVQLCVVGGGSANAVNICTSMCMTVNIRECAALMSPNGAKQPYMIVDLQLLATLGFGIAYDTVL